MKKYLCLALMFTAVCVYAQDDYSVNGVEEPQWKDFAPPAFINVNEPKGIGRLNDTAQYWYKRRIDFENNIEKCRTTEGTDAKLACYHKLKIKEYQKNSDYNARLEAIERSQMGPAEMYDRTNNMLPIGGFTDMLRLQPNELR